MICNEVLFKRNNFGKMGIKIKNAEAKWFTSSLIDLDKKDLLEQQIQPTSTTPLQIPLGISQNFRTSFSTIFVLDSPIFAVGILFEYIQLLVGISSITFNKKWWV
jgi:hypothetical protein